MKKNDIKYMELALDLAAKAKEKTYPNPMVGAVIVRRGRVVGRGYHRRAGEAHAEVRAIKDAAGKCKGAAMYVTLEPCDHYGKTPPCTKAVIASGIKSVNIAMKDPNPLNSGRGIRRLKKAGISVSVGACAGAARKLNRKYIKFITSGMPYVTVKLAQSLDGKIAARDGTSKWISSGLSRAFARRLRPGFGAIMVGINTVLNDDPFLIDEKKKGYSLKRVIVDSRLRMPLGSNIIKTRKKSPVIIATTPLAPEARLEKFRGMEGVDLIVTPARGKKVSMKRLLRELARRGVVSILAEGGGELIGSLLDGALIDEAMFFIAPDLIGGPYSSVKGLGVRNISKAVELRGLEVRRSGRDIFVRGFLK